MIRPIRLSFFFALGAMIPGALFSAPFASNVVLSGTNVSFILNEPADSLAVSINGGAYTPIPGAGTKGTKNFVLGNASDTFSIVVGKTDTVGYTIPTGGTIAGSANGLVATANASGFKLISDDTSVLNRFNSQRGLAVSNNPNAPNFGTAYISQSAAASIAAAAPSGTYPALPARTVGDGVYALRADQSDAFGNGNTAANPGGVFVASASTPWRNFVGPDGQLYVADFTDSNGNVYVMPPNMTTATAAFNGIGGPSAVPATQKHGSATAVYVEGSLGTNDLKIYTIDEDLTELTGTGAGNNTIKLNVWRYDVNGGPYPYTGAPTKINGAGTLLINGTDELVRGTDGKYYVSQLRSAGTDAATVIVLDASGAVIWNSFTVSGGAQDILRNAQGMAISEDQKWMALMLNNSDVAVIPLVGGIPDLANRLVVDTGTDVNSGRDIAFDAAGNIHYVSSGQSLYRVISPGGTNVAVTSWNGTSFGFENVVPEPASFALAAMGLAMVFSVRRSRRAA